MAQRAQKRSLNYKMYCHLCESHFPFRMPTTESFHSFSLMLESIWLNGIKFLSFPLDMVSGASAHTLLLQIYAKYSYAQNGSRKSTKFQRIALLSVALCLSPAWRMHGELNACHRALFRLVCALVTAANSSGLQRRSAARKATTTKRGQHFGFAYVGLLWLCTLHCGNATI